MYCQNCGKTLNDNLNYCSHCGSRVENKASVVRNSSSSMLGIGAVFIGVIGLIAFYPLLRELLHSSLDTVAVIVILVANLLTVLSMFAVLVGHVRKNSGEINVKGTNNNERYQSPGSFRSVNTSQLPEPREPIMSVTDHTTRTLVEVPAKDT